MKKEKIINFLRNCPICGEIPEDKVYTHYREHLDKLEPYYLGEAELYSSDGTASISVETSGGVSIILVRNNDSILSFEVDFELLKDFCQKILTEI